VSEILSSTALELGRRIRAGELSAEEACRWHLERAEATETTVAAFLDLPAEVLLDEARAIDARLAAGETLSALAGVPVAVKDNICTQGRPTTAGSRILAGWIPPYDATVVARLRAGGALPFGKTNCDELGMGSSTEHSAFRPTRNPWAGRVDSTGRGFASSLARAGRGTCGSSRT